MPTIFDKFYPNGFVKNTLKPTQGEGFSPIFDINFPNGYILPPVGGESGVSTFLALTDTPVSYLGSGGFGVRVNSGQTGLEFFDLTSLIEGIKYSWANDAARTAQTGMVAKELGVQRDTGNVYRYDGAVWSIFFNLQDGFFSSATQGDVLFRGAGGWTTLPPGPSGQVLTSQGGLSDVVWAPVAGTLPAGVQGNILYHNGVGWVVLAPDTSGKVLTTQGVGSNPQWTTISGTLPAGVQGNILYHNGVGWVVLPPGSSGDFLQTQGVGANPQWAAAGGGSSPLSIVGPTQVGSAMLPSTRWSFDPTVTVTGTYSAGFGYLTQATGASGSMAHGNAARATGTSSHAEGIQTLASGQSSHAEGQFTTASGSSSHCEGLNTQASGHYASHCEGFYSVSSGYTAHAEGTSTVASGTNSHAEGNSTQAIASNTHAGGRLSQAQGAGSFVHGRSSNAIGAYSAAFGKFSNAYGDYSFAHGYVAQPYGLYAAAFGFFSYSNGYASFAANSSKAVGDYSFAMGLESLANHFGEFAFSSGTPGVNDPQGESQTSIITMYGVILNGETAWKKFVVGAETGEYLQFFSPYNQSWCIRVDAVWRQSDTSPDSAYYQGYALVRSNGINTATIVGQSFNPVISEGPWTAGTNMRFNVAGATNQVDLEATHGGKPNNVVITARLEITQMARTIP